MKNIKSLNVIIDKGSKLAQLKFIINFKSYVNLEDAFKYTNPLIKYYDDRGYTTSTIYKGIKL